MRTSGFVIEDLMRGSSVDFSDQFGPEMTDLDLEKLGCLENSWFGDSENSPLSVIPTTSTTIASNRMKPPSLGGSSFRLCQVDGCNLDLSSASNYQQKFRVCDYHSKSAVVFLKGLECRFCQQCTRFHALSEFDQRKRSCRERLSAHNARRRKLRQEKIASKSSTLPNSSFYGGRKHMNLLLNSWSQIRNASISDFENSYNSRFTLTEGEPQMTGNQTPYAISVYGTPSNGVLVPNSTSVSRVLHPQGFQDVTSATLSESSDFHRALSLLSTSSSGSCESVLIPFDDTAHESRMSMLQTPMDAVPLSSFLRSEYWHEGQPSTYPRVHSLTSDIREIGLNEGFQHPKTSYGMDFYFSPLD